MNIKEGYDAVIREVGKYDAVVLWDIHTMDRNVRSNIATAIRSAFI